MLAMMFERCASKDLPWSLPECFDAMIPKRLVGPVFYDQLFAAMGECSIGEAKVDFATHKSNLMERKWDYEFFVT